MATTDTRTGFRLPWSADHHDADDPGTERSGAVDETQPAPQAGLDATPESGIEGAPAETSAETPAEPTQEADAAPVASSSDDRGSAAGADVPSTAPTKRPTKFLADLTRAMRAAAETERAEILERFGADAKAYAEELRERATGESAVLRTDADDDIAGIRDRSKAEIARIREETEARIANRRSELDAELEAHAARVEREIERVNGSVDAFNSRMDAFFNDLIAVDDPARFAALAGSLPEPPSLEELAAGRITVEPARAPEPIPEPQPVEARPAGLEGASAPALAEPSTTQEGSPDVAPSTDGTSVGPAPGADPWAGLSFEDRPSAEAAAGTPAPDASTSGSATATAVAGSGSQATAEMGDVTSAATADPRVAALGLTPDFAAAEAEAMSGVDPGTYDDGSEEELPTMDEGAVAARLAHLVAPTEEGVEPAHTQMIVAGLSSVASISGFKRHLAQLAGVRGVSVSSGPDGEFVFGVTHGPAVDLAAVVPTIPGFAARVLSNEDGVMRVAAHDPEAAA
jgi:hypothetical protein